MEEKRISIEGIETNFKIAGEGPAILILHGWGSSSDSWLTVQNNLTERGYRVVCPDLPGFGKSGIIPEPWGVPEYQKWVLSFIKSQGLREFFLLAHSFGGRIAIRLAAFQPEGIKGLILCDTAGIKRPPNLKTQLILFLSKIGNVILAPRFLTRIRDTARNVFYLFLRNRDYIKASKIMRASLRKVLAEDARPLLSKIKIPTLIIWGKRDKMVPLEDAYILEKEIQGSELEVLKKVDHSPHLQSPERMSRLVLNFLKKKS